MSATVSPQVERAATRKRSESTKSASGDTVMATRVTSGILKQLRTAMKDNRLVPAGALTAYIIPSEDAHQSEYIGVQDERRAFVSGFTGSRGLAAVTMTGAAMWTDGRYFLQARQQMDENWTMMKEGTPDSPTLHKWLIDEHPNGGRVGVDPFLISAERFRALTKELGKRNISMESVPINLVDKVWGAGRPSETSEPLMTLSTEFAGETWQSKVGRIRAEMQRNKAKLLVLSALDEIAWTFNLRGSDIHFNPVFFAYALIGLDCVGLFLDERKVTPEVRNHLGVDADVQNGTNGNSNEVVSVQLYDYSSILDVLRQSVDNYVTEPGEKVWVALATTSQALAHIVPETKLLDMSSPVAAMKAKKNSVELEGMKNAHLKDAVAHCEFLHWLELEMSRDKAPNITEIMAATKFEELRKEQENYVSLSFETISSVGPHGAIIHYSPTEDTDATITTDQLYLVDSGGQYRDGTTDVTRTTCFSEPTAYQKECYTLVFKAHVALAMQKFPEGTTGVRLDSVCRLAMWNVGLDYRHGTGHGVGHFLNVHEGPISVGYRGSNPLKEGLQENMVVTIEPGYYEDGEFGCRIENVYALVETATKYQFQNTKFLTFQSLTLVPIQRRLLQPPMLTAEEIEWLNAYHARCLDEVGPVLERQGKSDVYRWLEEQTRPLG